MVVVVPARGVGAPALGALATAPWPNTAATTMKRVRLGSPAVKRSDDQSESHAEKLALVHSDHKTMIAVNVPAVFSTVGRRLEAFQPPPLSTRFRPYFIS